MNIRYLKHGCEVISIFLIKLHTYFILNKLHSSNHSNLVSFHHYYNSMIHFIQIKDLFSVVLLVFQGENIIKYDDRFFQKAQ